MTRSITDDFKKCCGSPHACTNVTAYPCPAKAEHDEERGHSVAGLMVPGGMNDNPLEIESSRPPPASSERDAATRDQIGSGSEAPPMRSRADFMAAADKGREATKAAAELMRAQFREDAALAKAAANSLEAQAERAQREARRGRSRDFGMDR